jgi:hypothetical protein
MKNPVPAALISATLARRGTIDPDALLDCLSLIAVLDARSPDLAQHRISRAQAAGHQPDLFASVGPVE